MSVSLGVQFPNAITNLDSNVIIRKIRAKVNPANKKAPKWFTSRGLQLPKLVQTIIDAKNSISKKFANVNLGNKKEQCITVPSSHGSGVRQGGYTVQ